MSNIWIAAADNDLDAVKKYITEGQSPNSKDGNGYTPIHAAASYGHIALLKYLIENGGDVNITDNDGDTPLHSAEAPLSARTLIQLGADAEPKNNDGQTPLDKAVDEQEFPELINYFMNLLGKADKDVEFKVNFQGEDQNAPQPGERSLTDEQRKELEKIVQDGTDAQLEEFLAGAMANQGDQDPAKKLKSSEESNAAPEK